MPLIDDLLIANMRSRIERCRRLALQTTDRQAADVLRQIAAEGEADIERLLRPPTANGINWTLQ